MHWWIFLWRAACTHWSNNQLSSYFSHMTIVQNNSRNNSLIGCTPRENKASTTCNHRQGVMTKFWTEQKNFQICFSGGTIRITPNFGTKGGWLGHCGVRFLLEIDIFIIYSLRGLSSLLSSYDITCPNTFDHVNWWLDELQYTYLYLFILFMFIFLIETSILSLWFLSNWHRCVLL